MKYVFLPSDFTYTSAGTLAKVFDSKPKAEAHRLSDSDQVLEYAKEAQANDVVKNYNQFLATRHAPNY